MRLLLLPMPLLLHVLLLVLLWHLNLNLLRLLHVHGWGREWGRLRHGHCTHHHTRLLLHHTRLLLLHQVCLHPWLLLPLRLHVGVGVHVNVLFGVRAW